MIYSRPIKWLKQKLFTALILESDGRRVMVASIGNQKYVLSQGSVIPNAKLLDQDQNKTGSFFIYFKQINFLHCLKDFHGI